MSYTIPDYVDTKEQAVLALASTIKGEAVTGGDGSVNRALDILADVLAEQDVSVPQTDAGAILALAQYASGMVKPEGTIAITENGEGIDVAQYATANVSVSGGGGDLTTATVSLTLPNSNLLYVGFAGIMEDEFAGAVNINQSGEVPFVMYKGAAVIDVVLSEGGDPTNFTFSSSGDIEPVTEPGSYFATGDCAITITVN